MTVGERLTALLNTFKYQINTDETRGHIQAAVRHFLMDTQAKGDIPPDLPLDVTVKVGRISHEQEDPNAIVVVLSSEMEAFLERETLRNGELV